MHHASFSGLEMSTSREEGLKTKRKTEGDIVPDLIVRIYVSYRDIRVYIFRHLNSKFQLAECRQRSHVQVYDIDLHGRNIRRVSNLEMVVESGVSCV